MPTYILGISAYYHDSAACLVEDGRIVAAAQEERFTRKKHDAGFPTHAVGVLPEGSRHHAGAARSWSGFYEKPLVKFERLLETYTALAPKGLRSYIMAMPLWLGEKLWMADDISDRLEGYEGEVMFGEHHESHAASAFYPSPFEQAAVVTMDGVGEWATSSIGVGRGSELEILRELRFPHSLGLLYSAFTYFTGFRVNSGEYKVMGLAPYGQPKYVKAIKDHLLEIKDDGSLWMNQEYFTYAHGLTMTGAAFERLFDGPARQAGIEAHAARDGPGAVGSGDHRRGDAQDDRVRAQGNRDARSVPRRRRGAQLRRQRPVAARRAVRGDLDSAGGGRCRRRAGRGVVAVASASRQTARELRGGGDVGAAGRVRLGATRCDGCDEVQASTSQSAGSAVCRRDERVVSRAAVFGERDQGRSSTRMATTATQVARAELADAVAAHLAQEKVIGLLQGRMEFGPRALGGRSILGDARSPKMQSVMNLKIKFRESFRPFAPTVLREHVAEWFELDGDSPYMLLVADVLRAPAHSGSAARPTRCGASSSSTCRARRFRRSPTSTTRRAFRRSGRKRTVSTTTSWRRFTGSPACPVIVNTSFNVRGEPIVCTPEDAYRCFMRTNMDVLVLENFVLEKSAQPKRAEDESWKTEFVLD